MFSIYCYDEDNGELVDIHREVEERHYKGLSMSLRHDGYLIKVFDENMSLVYTLG